MWIKNTITLLQIQEYSVKSIGIYLNLIDKILKKIYKLPTKLNFSILMRKIIITPTNITKILPSFPAKNISIKFSNRIQTQLYICFKKKGIIKLEMSKWSKSLRKKKQKILKRIFILLMDRLYFLQGNYSKTKIQFDS